MITAGARRLLFCAGQPFGLDCDIPTSPGMSVDRGTPDVRRLTVKTVLLTHFGPETGSSASGSDPRPSLPKLHSAVGN